MLIQKIPCIVCFNTDTFSIIFSASKRVTPIFNRCWEFKLHIFLKKFWRFFLVSNLLKYYMKMIIDPPHLNCCSQTLETPQHTACTYSSRQMFQAISLQDLDSFLFFFFFFAILIIKFILY